jgi:ABC-type multidrug transport system fused ATPase/permease subunit
MSRDRLRAFTVRALSIVLRSRLTPENWQDIRELAAFLAHYRRRMVMAGGTMALTVLLQLPLPFLIMAVVDHLIKTRDIGLFPLVTTGLLVLVLSTAAVNLAHGLLVALIREHSLGTLEMHLLERLHRAPIDFFHRHTSSYLATRIRADLRNLNALLAGPILNAVQSSLLIAGAIVSMFLLSWRMSLVCLATLPPFVITVVLFVREIRARTQFVQERTARYGALVQESLATVPIIKAFGAHRHSMARLRRSLRELIETVLRLEMTGSLSRRLTYVLGMMAPVAVLWFGAYEYLNGRLTIGKFVAFHAFLGYLFGPVQGLLGQNVQAQSALVSLRRLLDLMRTPVETASGVVRPLPASTDLALQGVIFGYRSERPVLEGVDLRVEEGETVGLLGCSGGGKSTLLRLLLRFHDPQEGRVLLGGRDLRELDLEAFRARFAVAFQEPYLWSGTIEENLRVANPGASASDLRRACEGAVAWDFLSRLPQGLQTSIGEGGLMLSAGQKVRVAIARALLRRAPILLLDEPTSALDPETAAELLVRLETHLEGRTALIVSHQSSALRIVDRAYVLEDGRCREVDRAWGLPVAG